MRNRLVALALLGAAAAACGGGSTEAASTTTTPVPAATTVPPSTTTSSTTVPTTSTIEVTTTTLPPHPLTGLPGRPSGNRVMIAKVSNAPKGRPQAGLNQADMVLEVLVEGGIGRFLAVFQSSYPDVVGPLRSMREVDPKLIEPFDARVLHSGGQARVLRDVAAVAIDEGEGRLEEGYERDPERPYLYSLMFTTAALPEVEETEPPVLLTFDSTSPAGSGAASHIDVFMSDLNPSAWTFTEGRYLRLTDGEPHLDADGVQLSADTVVVVFVEELSTGRRDASGAAVPDFEVIGEGEALVFRDGVVIEATWQRPSSEVFFTFEDEGGERLAMAPGRTWIHFTPIGRSVTWE